MKIVVDAMGGDNAPQAPVMGAVQANREYGVEIILVGRGEDILKTLAANGISDLPAGVAVTHASEVVEMCDDPATAFRKKKDSSLTVGLNLLKEGAGDAFVSAGSTGALLSGATLVTKRIKGIRRAALAPVVSGGRSAALICKLWDRRYGRVPDFVVLEGPLAGGHLGFSPQEAREAQAGRPRPLSALLAEVLESLAPFREKYGRDIPVFVAGGVKSGAELRRYMDQGAAGVQFATRFIATEECDASPGYKRALLDAEAEDVTIVQSPVGMPGRALRSPLIRRVEAGTQPKITRCDRCLAACDCKTAPYCISKALIAAVEGDWENGLFFCGANAGEVNTLSTVKEQMDQILNEWRTAP